MSLSESHLCVSHRRGTKAVMVEVLRLAEIIYMRAISPTGTRTKKSLGSPPPAYIWGRFEKDGFTGPFSWSAVSVIDWRQDDRHSFRGQFLAFC